eukprot:2586879-Prymnesium_polylepis.1
MSDLRAAAARVSPVPCAVCARCRHATGLRQPDRRQRCRGPGTRGTPSQPPGARDFVNITRLIVIREISLFTH